jgi:hypothetical protein
MEEGSTLVAGSNPAGISAMYGRENRRSSEVGGVKDPHGASRCGERVDDKELTMVAYSPAGGMPACPLRKQLAEIVEHEHLL